MRQVQLLSQLYMWENQVLERSENLTKIKCKCQIRTASGHNFTEIKMCSKQGEAEVSGTVSETRARLRVAATFMSQTCLPAGPGSTEDRTPYRNVLPGPWLLPCCRGCRNNLRLGAEIQRNNGNQRHYHHCNGRNMSLSGNSE